MAPRLACDAWPARDDALAREVLAGDRLRACGDIGWRAGTTISPPATPGGPDVDDVVGAAYRVLVMLTTMTVLPRSRRWRNVSMRRSLSRWCRPIEGVEDVEHAHEAGADLVARRMRCFAA